MSPVPPLAVGNVPVTPVVRGKPVPLVKVTDAGVFRIAPTPNVATPVTPSVPENVALAPAIVPVNVGDADITTLPVPVMALLTNPLEASVKTARLAVKLDKIGCAVNVATPVTPSVPDAVRLVNAPAAAVVVPTGPLNESPTAPV